MPMSALRCSFVKLGVLMLTVLPAIVPVLVKLVLAVKLTVVPVIVPSGLVLA